MPTRLGRHIVLDRGDDECVGVRLRVMMITRIVVIMVRTGGLDRALVKWGGFGMRADHMRPQVQHGRYRDDDYGHTPNATCGHAAEPPPNNDAVTQCNHMRTWRSGWGMETASYSQQRVQRCYRVAAT
jgi:hypothetical protein